MNKRTKDAAPFILYNFFTYAKVELCFYLLAVSRIARILSNLE